MPKYRIELSDGRKFEVEADAPPSEQDVLAAIGKQPTQPATQQAAPAELPFSRIGKFVINTIKNHPVQAGAMAASTAAAPFTGGMSLLPQLAAIGGASALGAGAGQLASGKTPDLGTMAKEGALGAVGQGIGRGVSAVAGKVAPIIGKMVLSPTTRIQKEFPDVVQTFLKERIPVGQSAVAGARGMESAAAAQQMAQAAEAAGASPVGPREIVGQFRGVRDEIVKRGENAAPEAAGQMKQLVDRAKELRRQGPKSVTRNQELKQSAQRDANKAFRAQDRGAQINDVGAELDKAVAVGRQKAAEARIPGIADQNKRTQSLMGLEGALEDAEMRNAGMVSWNPAHILRALAPGTTSHAVFGLNRVAQAPLPGGARTALLALSALLSGEQEPERP